MKNRTKKRCLLCEAVLRATSVPDLWIHPESATCGVRLTDSFGISADDRYYVADDEQIYEVPTEATQTAPEVDFDPDAPVIMLSSAFVPAEPVVDVIFANAGVPKLGGASGDRGWSSISTFQKCPYLWKRRYIDAGRATGAPLLGPGPAPLEVGSLTHVFLAIYYSRMIDANYPLDPAVVRDALLRAMVTPDHVNEAWRLFEAYTLFYANDDFRPLAVEFHLRDPRTNRSCRYDLIAVKEKASPGLLPGTYILDHKTKGRFDAHMHTEWQNDGELIGQWELYEKLKLEKRFGKLQGLCANMIGKQKDPRFERAWIVPSGALLRDHRRSLGVWSAAMDLAKATDNFPRARANCVARYGLCDQFGHCAQTEAGGEI